MPEKRVKFQEVPIEFGFDPENETAQITATLFGDSPRGSIQRFFAIDGVLKGYVFLEAGTGKKSYIPFDTKELQLWDITREV